MKSSLSRLSTVLLMAILALVHGGVRAETRESAVPSALQARADVQERIATTVRELITATDEMQRQDAMATAAALADEVAGGRVRLLQQLAIYLATAGGTEEAMGGALLFHGLEFQRQEILAAALPGMATVEAPLGKVLQEFAASVVIHDGSGDDPLALVLQVEAWRRAAADGAVGGSAEGSTLDLVQVHGLLDELALAKEASIRSYVATVRAGQPELTPEPPQQGPQN